MAGLTATFGLKSDMAEVTRPASYTGTTQRLVINSATAGTITLFLWGGGGGGGGNDWPGVGGAGSGGAFAQKTITVAAGDVIDVAVGGGGGAGVTGRSGAPGGSAGASYIVPATFEVWNSLSPATAPATYRVTNGAYCGFLNQYGVWGSPGGYDRLFERYWNIAIPTTGWYTVIGSCDNYGTVAIDRDPETGTAVFGLSVPGFQTTYSGQAYLTAGTHVVSLSGTNTGGPGSFGATITGTNDAQSFSGGYGGMAGYGGSSGGGGGSGGATVVFKNGTVVAVAGGGGGGGGGGHVGAVTGQSAPGSAGRASPGTNNGQNGRTMYGDGGGGGAGGGGWGAGNGGAYPGGDQGAYAGSAGGSLGDTTVDPTNTNPANANSAYRFGNAGFGGGSTQPGYSGQATILFNINGTSVRYGGSWQTVQQTYVKDQGTWKTVKDIYVKRNGVWTVVTGTNTDAPGFTSTGTANFGIAPRDYPEPPPPPDPGYTG